VLPVLARSGASRLILVSNPFARAPPFRRSRSGRGPDSSGRRTLADRTRYRKSPCRDARRDASPPDRNAIRFRGRPDALRFDRPPAHLHSLAVPPSQTELSAWCSFARSGGLQKGRHVRADLRCRKSGASPAGGICQTPNPESSK